MNVLQETFRESWKGRNERIESQRADQIFLLLYRSFMSLRTSLERSEMTKRHFFLLAGLRYLSNFFAR